MQKTLKTKTTFRIERTTFECRVFRRLEKFGGLLNRFTSSSTRFDSTQWGTSYDLKKTCLVSLERGGGVGNGALESGSSSHTKEKKDGCQWGFSQTLIFFSKRFFHNI